MSMYMIVGLVLIVLPIVIGFIGYLSRWPKLAPQHIEPHGKVWGRRCPKCQSEEFSATGDGYQKCAKCGHVFI